MVGQDKKGGGVFAHLWWDEKATHPTPWIRYYPVEGVARFQSVEAQKEGTCSLVAVGTKTLSLVELGKDALTVTRSKNIFESPIQPDFSTIDGFAVALPGGEVFVARVSALRGSSKTHEVVTDWHRLHSNWEPRWGGNSLGNVYFRVYDVCAVRIK